MKKKKVHVQEFDDVLYDWAKNVSIPDPTTGELLYLGTVIRMNNHLEALDPLTIPQLKELKEVVINSITYELSRRQTKKTT